MRVPDKPFFRLVLFLFQVVLLPPVLAQQTGLPVLNRALLSQLAAQQRQLHQAHQSRILALTNKPHWFISQTMTDGRQLSLQGFNRSGKPLYYTTFNNSYSGTTTNTNRVWAGGTAGLNLTGASPLLAGKLGIWDGGAVRPSHQELSGRIVNRDGTTNLSDHATHVAGTMIATGINSIAKGMAYQAPDLQTWYFDYDNIEIADAADELLLSNHSYGTSAGWLQSGSQWFWLGNSRVSTKDDVYFGYYDDYAQLWDDIAYQAPYYLMVKAVGNSRRMPEPAVGTPYYWLNYATGAWELNPQGRTAAMRRYDSYDVIPDHSVAKNILTVGAISPLANGYTQPSDAVSYLASSWGPTDDGRIKPDLVGNGIQVWSTFAGADNAYQQATGSSMAAPNITGSLLLLQQHHANLRAGSFMRAATLKGLAIHTAQEAGQYPGPDYVFGWGVLNTDEAARVLSHSGGKDLVSEKVLRQDSTYTRTLIASGTEPLKITISWTDPKGTLLPLLDSTALNNRTPMLVNDLDISLSDGLNTYLPWILNPDQPAAPAATGNNFRDNVEQILLLDPVPGAAYTLTVRHKNTLQSGSQAYGLIISGMAPAPYCGSAPAQTSLSRISSLRFGTIHQANASGCGGYADHTSLSTHVEPGKTMPLAFTLENCGPDPVEKAAKVFIDWNEDGDFDDAGELVFATGVHSGPAALGAEVAIPDFVRVGNGTRLRVVMAETADTAQVRPCGAYDRGQTADYTIRFVRQIKDVGITALTIPSASTLWAQPAQSVTVKIKNYDAIALSAIPVTVTVKDSTTPVATLTGTFRGTLQPLQEALFTLPGTFPVSPATTYYFTAATTLAGDQHSGNNSLLTTLSSTALAPGPAISATACPESPKVSLQGAGPGTISWFDAPAGGNRIGIGPELLTTFKPADNTYYAALNDFSLTTLTRQNNAEGSFASQENDTIYFQAATPLILDRVSINAGVGGQATVKLLRPDGTLADSIQLSLVPGPGEYGLNFVVPAAAGRYGLMLSGFCQGATASRHNGPGTIVFPYHTAGMLTITGSASGASYLYNWKIRPAGSPSARVSVRANGLLGATRPVVCAGANSDTLTFSRYHGSIVRWEKSTDTGNWISIAHTGPSLPLRGLSDTTRFRVVLQQGECSAAYSDPVTVLVNPSPAAIITAPAGTVLCPGGTLPLQAGGGQSYLWSTGDTTSQILVSQAGTYAVLVGNGNGCWDADTLAITTRAVAWTGQADNDWFNPANWSCQVPDAATDVHIPAGLSNNPVIGPGVATCRNLYIQGALTLEGGKLEMKGNFTNEGTFTHPGGTVELAGSGDRQLRGGIFNHLTINSPGLTTLGSDITVNGTLLMTQGNLHTAGHQVLLGPEATLSETENHYITGKVGATRTFDAARTSHSFGGLGLNISTAAAPGPIQVTRTTGLAPGEVTIQRAFSIHVLAPGYNDNLNATLDFHYFDHELNELDKEYLALYRSTDSGATWMLQENSLPVAGANTVSATGIRAFSDWTLADRFTSQTLPVNLLAFRAVRQQSDALLTWETAMEVNHAGMAIEVSADAQHYRQLHFIPAAASQAITRQQYRYLDQEPGKTGVRYYRLKQLDLDGSFAYYGPRAVSFERPTRGLQLYPNPGDGRLHLLAPAMDAGPLLLEIKDAAGKTVYATQKQLAPGPNGFQLDLRPLLKPGLYLVLGHYDNQVFPLKLVVH